MSSVPDHSVFVNGKFSWSRLINESRKKLVCSYYDDIVLNQSYTTQMFYNNSNGVGAGFRLGSEPIHHASNIDVTQHTGLKSIIKASHCTAVLFLVFFMTPRDGVFEITCNIDINRVDGPLPHKLFNFHSSRMDY